MNARVFRELRTYYPRFWVPTMSIPDAACVTRMRCWLLMALLCAAESIAAWLLRRLPVLWALGDLRRTWRPLISTPSIVLHTSPLKDSVVIHPTQSESTSLAHPITRLCPCCCSYLSLVYSAGGYSFLSINQDTNLEILWPRLFSYLVLADISSIMLEWLVQTKSWASYDKPVQP